jgi:hypothetical protein
MRIGDGQLPNGSGVGPPADPSDSTGWIPGSSSIAEP